MTPPAKGTPINRLPRASKRTILGATFDGDTESQLLSAIRLAANDFPDLRLWRLTQGGAVTRGRSTYTAGLSVGGASDLIGVLRLNVACEECYPLVTSARHDIGRFVALEVKTPQALARIRRAVARGAVTRLSRTEQNQLLFHGVVRTMGGFACYVDSVEAFRAAVERARKGESG